MPNIEVLTSGTVVNVPASSKQKLFISPLEVFFSQNVIYPRFADGRSVDDSVRQIRAIADDSEEKEVDIILEAPFPTIEVVEWAPRLRDREGKPILDKEGNERLGPEGLFTLDNRRLYALQRAAVAHYPRTCKVEVVKVRERYEVARHVKKFRTRTNGMAISISEWNGTGRDNARDFNIMRVWDWRSAVAAVKEGQKASSVEAADTGSCGCWEYLDPEGICRGPFSNWQMRQWWERKMLPPDLRIRAYDATAGCRDGELFRLVAEEFEDAPAPFAPGFSPRAQEREVSWQECAQCHRQRSEGWSARGQWFCSACWRKWSET